MIYDYTDTDAHFSISYDNTYRQLTKNEKMLRKKKTSKNLFKQRNNIISFHRKRSTQLVSM